MNDASEWIKSVETDGYGLVEISNRLSTSKMPKSFFDFCMANGLRPEDAIPIIVSDFMTRLEQGNVHYQNDILNRIMNSDLNNKREILERIYG